MKFNKNYTLPIVTLALAISAITFIFKVSAANISTILISTEKFNLSGNATIKTDDTSASNSSYVAFNSTSNTNFQPTSPYYSTFYYAWYKTQAIDGAWSYWSDYNNPPTTWFSHYLPDPKPAVFDPTTELYSVNDYNNFKWQVSKMAEAKLEVAIFSWWGQNGKEDIGFNNVINDFMKRADNPYPNLRWAMYYECEGISNTVCDNTSNPSVSKITSDLNYIKSKYVNSPYFLKVNGKPVMFVYGGAEDDVASTQTMTKRWKDANAATGNSFYLVLKLFSGFANDPNQPDSWHQYAPAVRSGSYGTYSSFVSPGFWLDDAPTTAARLPRDLSAFDSAVSTMINQNTTWKLVETWNEWGEGTSVEPGNQTTKDVNGKEILDPNGTPFGNSYIDILSKYLPPLEAGTGSNIGSINSTPTPVVIITPTPDNTNINYVFAGAGDIGGAISNLDEEVAKILDAIFVPGVQGNIFTAGDNVNEEPVYLEQFNTIFEPTWGRHKSIIRPAAGNHDYLDPNNGNTASGYFSYFGSQAGEPGKGYYSYNIANGNWHIIVINSNCSKVGGCNLNSPQEKWLKADLEANKNVPCKAAIWHHPLYSSGQWGSFTSMKQIFQDLYDYKVDFTVHGHNHVYERFEPQDANGVIASKGVREFVAGTGGKGSNPFPMSALANEVIRNDNTMGLLKFTLHEKSYEWKFIPVSGKTFTDSGSSNCNLT